MRQSTYYLLLSLLTCVTLTLAQTGAYTTCPSFVLITSRGCCDSRLNSYWTKPMANAVLAKLRGGIHYETDYDSDLDQGTLPPVEEVENSAELVAHVTAGSLVLTNYTATLALKCPDTKIATFAYSLGTFVQILAQNNPAFPVLRINANALWGSAFWAPNRTENAGTAKTGSGDFSLYGFSPLRTPLLMVPVTADFCLTGDYLCTGVNVGDAHHHYNSNPWLAATVNFFVNKLKEAGVKAK